VSNDLDSLDLAVLPVDELGIWLLRILRNDPNRTFSRGPTQMNVLKQVGERMPSDKVYARRVDPDAAPHLAQALAEAWDWLTATGLIAEAVAGMLAIPLQGYYFVTRYGERVAAYERPREWLSAERRLGLTLHPRLEERARRQFVMGEFEAAALIAMREVEIAVRDAAGLAETVVGTDLMNRAFGEGGPLADASVPSAERQGLQSLYRAAISVFKNPASHRRVWLDDPTEAAEVVLFADLLLRMLDRAAALNRPSPT
jgi:uncharacterized protein (TIGR02391 family)